MHWIFIIVVILFFLIWNFPSILLFQLTGKNTFFVRNSLSLTYLSWSFFLYPITCTTNMDLCFLKGTYLRVQKKWRENTSNLLSIMTSISQKQEFRRRSKHYHAPGIAGRYIACIHQSFVLLCSSTSTSLNWVILLLALCFRILYFTGAFITLHLSQGDRFSSKRKCSPRWSWSWRYWWFFQLR